MPPAPHNRKEAFSRVLIDTQLRDADWRLDDGVSIRYECQSMCPIDSYWTAV